MDFGKFGKFIIAMGFVAVLFGSTGFLAARDVEQKAASENFLAKIQAEATSQMYKQKARKYVVTGGIIMFVGFAIAASSKKKKE